MHYNMKNIFFIFIFLKLSYSERLHEQIYSSIEGSAPCFRRLNGTHQMGCSSSNKGAVGIAHIVTEVGEAHWLTLNASAGPYVAVVSTVLFDDVVNIFLSHPENIAGVVVFENSSLETSAFSQDSKCPNEYYSAPGSTCSSTQPSSTVWNKKGNNLIRTDIPFPTFFLPTSRYEEITKIEECYKRYNADKNNQKGRPLCSVQLHSFMFAAVDSTVCMRRSAASALLTPAKVCDPLGDTNVYSTLFPRVKVNGTSEKPTIFVTARIDSASLFDGVSPGTASSAVGMVTLITAATALSKMISPNESKPYDYNVLWTLFNGETFDYIGSQNVAYELLQKRWPPSAPLDPMDIPLHLEIGQIGGALSTHRDSEAWPLNVFAPLDSNNLDKISEMVNDLTSNVKEYNMSLLLTPTNNLPPSSLHSFRRILKNFTDSGSLTELLIADHNEQFTNLFYNSALDSYEKIGFQYHNITIGVNGTFVSTDDLIANGTMKRTEPQVKIALLATAIARTLYKKVFGVQYTGNVSTSAHLVDEMLYCFLKSQACRLLTAANYASSGDDNLPEKPGPLYVGVQSWPGTASVFAGHIIALLTGDHLPLNKSRCDAMHNVNYSYYWLNGWNRSGVCIQTTMNFSQAISPAFYIKNYDFTSGLYSTWTESVWHSMWARVFVASSGGGAQAAVISGSVATLLAAIATYWLQKHSSRIFVDAPVATVAADASTGTRTVNC